MPMTDIHGVTDFIDDRLSQILARPLMWGPIEALESLVLTLLQVRVFVVCGHSDDAEVTSHFRQFLRDQFPHTASLPALHRLKAVGRGEELPALLAAFVVEERERQNERSETSAPNLVGGLRPVDLAQG
jgi:hypothetical protein